jgi:hypothetical protein
MAIVNDAVKNYLLETMEERGGANGRRIIKTAMEEIFFLIAKFFVLTAM